MDSITNGAELSTSKSAIEQLYYIIKSLKTELEAYIDAVNAKIGDLNKNIADAQTQIETHTTLSKEITDKQALIDSQAQQINQQLEQNKQQETEKLKELTDLKTALDATKLTNTQLENEKTSIAAEMKTLKETADKVNEMELLNAELTNQKTGLEQQLADLNTQNMDKIEKEQKIENLENKLKKLLRQTTINNALHKNRLQQLTQINNDVQNRILKLQSELNDNKDASNTEKQNLESTIDNMRKQLTDLDTITKEKNTLQTHQTELADANAKLTAENTACQETINSLNQQIAGATEQIKIMQEQLEAAKTNISNSAQQASEEQLNTPIGQENAAVGITMKEISDQNPTGQNTLVSSPELFENPSSIKSEDQPISSETPLHQPDNNSSIQSSVNSSEQNNTNDQQTQNVVKDTIGISQNDKVLEQEQLVLPINNKTPTEKYVSITDKLQEEKNAIETILSNLDTTITGLTPEQTSNYRNALHNVQSNIYELIGLHKQYNEIDTKLKNLKEYTNYGNYTISNPDYNNQRRENIENLNDTIGEINKNNEELEENKAKLKEIERIIAPTEGRKTLLGRLEQNIETPIAKRTLKQINVVKKAWPKIRQLNQGKSTPTPPEKGDSQTSFVNKMTGTNDLLNTPSKSAPSSGLPPTPPETSKSRPNSPYYRDNKSSTLRKQATETQYGKSSSLSPSSSSASLTSQSRPLSGRSDDSTSRPSNASTDSSLSRSSSQSGYPKLINSNSTSSIRTIGTKGNTQSRPPFNSAVRPHTAPGYGLSRKGGKNTRKHKPSNHTNTHNKKTHKQHQSNKQTRKQHKQSHKHKRTIKRQ